MTSKVEVDAAFKRLLEREDTAELAIIIGGELARLRWENEALTARCVHLGEMVDVAVNATSVGALVKGRRAQGPSEAPRPDLAHELSDDPEVMIPRVEAGKKYLGVTDSINWRFREKKPGWPQPIKISRKNVQYRQCEVKRYLEAIGSKGGARERGNAAMALAQV